MKQERLGTLLRREGKLADDVIEWAYYAYGFLSCTGKSKVSELPAPVKFGKCFEIQNGVYCVDGAL